MNDDPDRTSSEEVAQSSVAHGILAIFLDQLSHEEGYEEVAARLRKTILVDGNLKEPALRTALFGDDVP